MNAAIGKQAVQSKSKTGNVALQHKFVVMRQDCESVTAVLVSYSQLLSGEHDIG